MPCLISTRPAPPPRSSLSLALAGASLLASCAPDLPQPDPRPAATPAPAAEAAPWVDLWPDAPLDAAPQVLRAGLHLPGMAAAEVDLERVLLVQGEVRDAHLRQIVRGELSKALSERLVPALVWAERADEPAPGELRVTLAPTAPLLPGETYALASGAPPFVQHLQITEGGPPLLTRVWPPPEEAATAGLGVWCGDEELPAEVEPAQLDPGGPAGTLRRGAAGDIGRTCVRFEADPSGPPPGASEGPFAPPPALGLGLGAPLAALDPRPLGAQVAAPVLPAAPCEPDEVPFGPACARVADDRISVRSLDAPLLWAVAGEGLDVVIAAGAGDPLLIAPLPPLSSIALDVAAVDAAGKASWSAFAAATLAPQPHVVITEVLANPLGPEPSQEWVELYNDGLAPADLGGYALVDVGGETALPSAVLPPGSHALVVNEGFVPDDELDPPPAPGALLVTVAKLGKNGLANGGEPLRLEDASGAVVSRSPAAPAPKAGMSLARVSPRSPDGLSSSFVTGWPTPGAGPIL